MGFRSVCQYSQSLRWSRHSNQKKKVHKGSWNPIFTTNLIDKNQVEHSTDPRRSRWLHPRLLTGRSSIKCKTCDLLRIAKIRLFPQMQAKSCRTGWTLKSNLRNINEWSTKSSHWSHNQKQTTLLLSRCRATKARSLSALWASFQRGKSQMTRQSRKYCLTCSWRRRSSKSRTKLSRKAITNRCLKLIYPD